MKFTIITFFIIFNVGVLAQPELDIKPNRIEFEDLFNRIDYVFLINKGDAILTIDSINYNDSLYILEFENNLTLPFTIIPDDSIRMNVFLTAFYQVTINDTSDTIFVYNNGIQNPKPLEVRIKFFEDEFGEFNGAVRDSLNPVDSATVYFFYNGIYLLDTAKTSSSGNYRITLPEGDYTIGVEKEGYYVVFHDSTYDPFFAELVELDSGDVKTINFNLKKIENNSLSVSGQIIDSVNGINVNKGIIIVRTGTHVPVPFSKENTVLLDTINAFAGFIKEDGSYLVNVQIQDYYYLQAYTNNFLPGFYNDEGIPAVFWQNADSVFINGNITDKNIPLVRDSSYGAGGIGGLITFSMPSDGSDFEGITILAKNINNGALYSYNFGKELGEFNVTNIPYGTYELVAQKIGLDNTVSQTVVIDPLNNQITGINLNFIINNVEDDNILPDGIILYQNYPNPFNPITNISFYLPQTSDIKLKVFNVLGELVETIVDTELSSGFHTVTFSGSKFASGIYLILLETNEFRLSKKMLLLK
ncbi:MAG: carboxypeptidase regulatory-like domain-containing protein [Ignavibacteriaceae bacterium]|nr:carboxypeptidase regulatory-like domain-containing protein [Ignavibacteriaceae bacterium]